MKKNYIYYILMIKLLMKKIYILYINDKIKDKYR